MATHTRKRQFLPSASQSSITSYFDRSATLTTSSQPAPSRSPLSPPLPDAVQSRLINVGMRVRKSVPEGYKTHKTLPPHFSSSSSQQQRSAVGSKTDSSRPPPSSAPASFDGSRKNELQPFCGLHAVGGLSSQGDVEVPALGWSQSTLASESGNEDGGRKKRSYEEDIEDELDAIFDDQEDLQTRVGRSDAVGERPMARARGRMKGGRTGVSGRVEFMEGDFDDEDVGFLQPMDVDV